MFKKKLTDEDAAKADRIITIDYLTNTSEEDYKKVLKIVEIRRKANIDIQIIEFGSKKAALEALKASDDISEAESTLDGFEEVEK